MARVRQCCGESIDGAAQSILTAVSGDRPSQARSDGGGRSVNLTPTEFKLLTALLPRVGA